MPQELRVGMVAKIVRNNIIFDRGIVVGLSDQHVYPRVFFESTDKAPGKVYEFEERCAGWKIKSAFASDAPIFQIKELK